MEIKEEKPTVFMAIESGLLESVLAISAAEGSSVFSLQDDKGYTPAHWACFRGHEEIVRLILDSNGPIDKPSNNELGAHPIHWACVNGHVAIVDILLQAGVSVNVVDNKGCHMELMRYLIHCGLNPKEINKYGQSTLHLACLNNNLKAVQELHVKHELDINKADTDGRTPLMLASASSNTEMVDYLQKQIKKNKFFSKIDLIYM
ncbi:HIP14 [Mytilus edulis]|uniref:ZDHHC13_17 n=1 Tax=Mytilus edulis TaxID=6550 RepID=A0A8S3T7A0_MYTED|nr:HIP14 [Mytilus edulis]